jgi:hypothetical protein
MFRFALFGIACLAVAAYTLVGTLTQNPPELPSDQNGPEEDKGRLRDHLIPIRARLFHAKFSVN